jgi:hypothetical protein
MRERGFKDKLLAIDKNKLFVPAEHAGEGIGKTLGGTDSSRFNRIERLSAVASPYVTEDELSKASPLFLAT